MPKLLRCGTHIWRKYAVLILILLFCPNFILFLHSQLKKKNLYCKNNQSHMKKKVCSGVKFIFFCWFTTMFCMNKMPFSFKKQNKQKKTSKCLASFVRSFIFWYSFTIFFSSFKIQAITPIENIHTHDESNRFSLWPCFRLVIRLSHFLGS